MKNLLLAIALLIISSTILAQNTTNAALIDPKSPNEPEDYSESIPYQPTLFPQKKADKKQKEKEKSKDKKDENKQETANQIQSYAISDQFELPIYIFDKEDKPVLDLKKEDFTLFVDDKEQQIEKVETRQTPLNVVLLLDVSASITSFELENYKKFVTQFAEKLIPQNKIKIISFAEKAKILCDFTNDLEVIKKEVKKLEVSGGTSIYEVVEAITKKDGKIDSEEKIVYILTDGVDTTSQKSSYQRSLIYMEFSNSTVFPLYFDTSKMIYVPKSGNQNQIMGQILGKILNGATVSTTGQIPGSTVEDYQLGIQYLMEIAILSGGQMLKIKTLGNLTKEDFVFLSEKAKPHYYLSFKYSETLNSDRRIQIRVRVNRSKLLIRTRGSRILTIEQGK